MNLKFSHRSESSWAEVRSRIEAASFTVRAGVLSGESEDGTPLVDVAAFNELGTSTAPARPFISPAMREHRAEAARLMGEAVKLLINEGSTAGIEHLGETVVQWIRQKILSGPFVPLAKATVRRKGHDRPLLDTLLMYDSITYEVRS